jgi:endogenous inhibitor of DNA gyrase (YacG/DUF329 family)
MKLFVTCSSCYKDIKLKQKANTKFKFEREYGEEIEVKCPHCGTSNTRHVNRVFAKPEWYWFLVSFIISIVLSLILIFIIGGIALVFISLPGFIAFGEQKSINAFNRGMIVRRQKRNEI